MVLAESNSTRQANSFDFLRFISSTFVIISHSYYLIGKESEEALMVLTQGTYHFSSLGLTCFFAISGFLVTQSVMNSTSIFNYAWKRALRILPALILVILFTMLIIGPLFNTLPLRDYFTSSYTYTYLRNIIFIAPLQWQLPGLFTGNHGKSANGSLWTLTLEGRLYILLGLLYLLRLFKIRWLCLALFCIAAALAPWFIKTYHLIPVTIYLVVIFFAGVVAQLYKDKIIYNKWLALLAIAEIIVSCFTTLLTPLSFIAFPYLIFYIAQLKSPLNRFGRYGDFSYGLFLFSFPVQQCIVQISKINISVAVMIFLSMILTMPFAMLSWYLVESKALRYKNLIK
jgi:peptidoglycan/LPS O-acetylase OafA/YrhL